MGIYDKTRRRLIKLSFIICHLSLSVVLTACGDFFEPNEATLPTAMTLSRHDVTVMEGDTCVIRPLFTPDSISNRAVFWMTADQQVARFLNADTLVAVGQGSTQAIAISVSDYRKADTCRVSVINRWRLTANFDYPEDMVVYADIRVHGQPVSDDMIIGAFCGDELRGVGQTMERRGVRYTLIRVWGPYAMSNETIIFRCYDRRRYTLEEFNEALSFDGESHGSPSNLFRLTIE